MPFDELQPIEYGWVPPTDENGYHFGIATRRSQRATLLTEILRSDQHPKWLAETEKVLFKKGKRFGTPMDYAREEMRDFRKLLIEVRIINRLRHPFGVAHPNYLKDPVFGGKDKLWTADGEQTTHFWFPKTDYNTDNFRISENRVRSSEMRILILNVFSERGHADWDMLPQEVKDATQEIINELAGDKGVYSVQTYVWLPWSLEPEQADAKEYTEECDRYQASKAGRKAKRLLLEHLTPAQKESYWKKGYFFVVPRMDLPMEDRRVYVIERSYPNGNVHTVKRRKVRHKRWREAGEFWFPTANLCFHTTEPYAVDDILLSQKLTLEADEEAFRAEANITGPSGGGKIPLDWCKRSV